MGFIAAMGREKRCLRRLPVLAEKYIQPVNWPALLLEHPLDHEDVRAKKALLSNGYTFRPAQAIADEFVATTPQGSLWFGCSQ